MKIFTKTFVFETDVSLEELANDKANQLQEFFDSAIIQQVISITETIIHTEYSDSGSDNHGEYNYTRSNSGLMVTIYYC